MPGPGECGAGVRGGRDTAGRCPAVTVAGPASTIVQGRSRAAALAEGASPAAGVRHSPGQAARSLAGGLAGLHDVYARHAGQDLPQP